MPIKYIGEGDYGYKDLVLQDGDTIRGTFKNVRSFIVPQGVVAAIERENYAWPTRIWAEDITIAGTLDATGQGFGGGCGAGGNFTTSNAGITLAFGRGGVQYPGDFISGLMGDAGKIISPNPVVQTFGGGGGEGGSWLGISPSIRGDEPYFAPGMYPPGTNFPRVGGKAGSNAYMSIGGGAVNANLDGGDGGYASLGINGDNSTTEEIHHGAGGGGGSSAIHPTDQATGGGAAGACGGGAIALYAKKITITETGKILSNDKIGGGGGGGAYQAGGGGGTSKINADNQPVNVESYVVAQSTNVTTASFAGAKLITDQYIWWIDGQVVRRVTIGEMGSPVAIAVCSAGETLNPNYLVTGSWGFVFCIKNTPSGIKLVKINNDTTYYTSPALTVTSYTQGYDHYGQGAWRPTLGTVTDVWGLAASRNAANRVLLGGITVIGGTPSYRVHTIDWQGDLNTFSVDQHTEYFSLPTPSLPVVGSLKYNGQWIVYKDVANNLHQWKVSIHSNSHYAMWPPEGGLYVMVVYYDAPTMTNEHYSMVIPFANGTLIDNYLSEHIVYLGLGTYHTLTKVELYPLALTTIKEFTPGTANYDITGVAIQGGMCYPYGDDKVTSTIHRMFGYQLISLPPESFSAQLPTETPDTGRGVMGYNGSIYTYWASSPNFVLRRMDKILVPGPMVSGAAGGTNPPNTGGVGGVRNSAGQIGTSAVGWVSGDPGQAGYGGKVAYQGSTPVTQYQSGAGGRGAGGGILLKSLGANVPGPQIVVRGKVDNYGGLGETNGGTLKVFYTGHIDIESGVINTGRLFLKKIPKGVAIM